LAGVRGKIVDSDEGCHIDSDSAARTCACAKVSDVVVGGNTHATKVIFPCGGGDSADASHGSKIVFDDDRRRSAVAEEAELFGVVKATRLDAVFTSDATDASNAIHCADVDFDDATW
jgi:hypothetical protein